MLAIDWTKRENTGSVYKWMLSFSTNTPITSKVHLQQIKTTSLRLFPVGLFEHISLTTDNERPVPIDHIKKNTFSPIYW